MLRRLPILAGVAAFALVAGACSDDNGSFTGPNTFNPNPIDFGEVGVNTTASQMTTFSLPGPYLVFNVTFGIEGIFSARLT
jgi:hypothetical protein